MAVAASDGTVFPNGRDIRSPQRFVLGTAQLGLKYGIANSTGKPSLSAAIDVVRAASANGVIAFDTAQDYGDSEFILGVAFRELGLRQKAQVTSKLTQRAAGATSDEIADLVDRTLDTVGVEGLWALLLHDEAELDRWQRGLGESLIRCRQAGKVVQLGVSTYSLERTRQALDTEGIDVIQVPSNLFDRRMQRAGIFELAADRGKRIVVRSVYLQGLLLLEPERAPPRIPDASRALSKLAEFCVRHNVDRDRFAIDYALGSSRGAMVVIGAEEASQVARNCELMSLPPLSESLREAWDQTWPDDRSSLLDPRLWI